MVLAAKWGTDQCHKSVLKAISCMCCIDIEAVSVSQPGRFQTGLMYSLSCLCLVLYVNGAHASMYLCVYV